MSRKSIFDIGSLGLSFCDTRGWLSIGAPVFCSLLLLCVSAPTSAQGAKPYRIAVAPFFVADSVDRTAVGTEGGASALDRRSRQIAQALSRRLAERPLERVIAPDAFVAKAEFEPPASVIRQWAFNAFVDTVVVGRVSETPESEEDAGWIVETVLRSGHSGAEQSRHQVTVRGPLDLDASADRLAAAILQSLGYTTENGVAAAPYRDPRSPEPPLLEIEASEPGSQLESESRRGLDSEFELGRLREDSPIEIKADEAEIVDRGEDRKLVFQRNVKVRQGNIRLESDLLEAEYRKGEPEPDRLVAKGSVYVDQGYRRAKCDRAVYLRAAQTLSCEGRAELVQGCDVVRGDSIKFDLAGDQAHVIGAASIVIRPKETNGMACESTEGSL